DGAVSVFGELRARTVPFSVLRSECRNPNIVCRLRPMLPAHALHTHYIPSARCTRYSPPVPHTGVSGDTGRRGRCGIVRRESCGAFRRMDGAVPGGLPCVGSETIFVKYTEYVIVLLAGGNEPRRPGAGRFDTFAAVV